MALDSAQATVQYNAGFIVLSYLVSLVGCVTTLELLHRRTSRRGLYNWYLFVTSCVCMGGIGIWSMHFIGNRAIVLNDGQAGTQIVYSIGFTAVSFFLPIVVLLLAFYLLGVLDRGNWYWIMISGLLTGTAVCGMHYVGQLGILNYDISYRVENVVGAAIIAVVASFVALSVFFKLRDTWTDSLWKRFCCAAVLACAVSGMHWTAAVGTIYHFKDQAGGAKTHSREQTVIVCAVLSIAACVILLGLTMLGGYRKRLSRTQAKQLVLACAYFDEHGRIMVSPEGSLPCEKITDRYVEKTFGEDELNRTHPSFVWVFKASRNWAALKDLIPGMKESLETDPKSSRYFLGVHADNVSLNTTEDFSGMFKKLFCVAALTLANNLHEPIESLGPLFEEPLETGTLFKKNLLSRLRPTGRSSRAKKQDVEAISTTPSLIGRGQYLFVDRQLNKTDVVKYGARGYRFAALKQVAEALANNMQIPQDVMLNRLERMRMYSSRENLMPAGMHLAVFCLRPSIQKSFDLLVPTKTQCQLPHVTFTFTKSVSQDMETLRKFHEWTIGDILKALIHQSGSSLADQSFRWELYRTFSQLVELVGDPLVMNAKFSSKQIPAPCRSTDDGTSTSTCILYSVRMISTVDSRSPRSNLTYVPLSFFSAQQQLEGSPWSHEIFAKQAHLEFAYLGLGKTTGSSKAGSRKSSVVEGSVPSTPTSVLRQSFGGVSRGMPRRSVDTQDNHTHVPSETSNDETVELNPVSPVPNVTLGSFRHPGVDDSGTFVSQLFALFKL